MTIKVPVTIVTFVHKDTGKAESFFFDDSRDQADSFEGYILGEFYNVSGFYKAANAVVRAGHREVKTEKIIEIEI